MRFENLETWAVFQLGPSAFDGLGVDLGAVRALGINRGTYLRKVTESTDCYGRAEVISFREGSQIITNHSTWINLAFNCEVIPQVVEVRNAA